MGSNLDQQGHSTCLMRALAYQQILAEKAERANTVIYCEDTDLGPEPYGALLEIHFNLYEIREN